MNPQAAPKITVITPSFNQGKFIKETIDSVLAQSYPNLEYWVMDGGSTDETVTILKSYGEKINWISEPDSGQTDALNKGIRRATGEIITYINSDDVYLPNTLNTVAEYFTEHPQTQWVTGDYFIIDEAGKKIQSFVANYKKFLHSHLSLSLLLVANPVIQPNTFWRRSLMSEVGLFDETLHLCMDYDCWLRIMQRYPVAVLHQHFSLFRIHAKSKGGEQYTKQFAEEYAVARRYTTNTFLLALHKLHATLIVLAYSFLK